MYTYLCTCTWINDCESTHYHLKCTCTVHTYGKLLVSILVLQLMIIFRTPLSTNFDILMCFCYQKQYFRRLIKSNERSVLLTWFMGQKPHFLTMLQVTYVFHFFQHFIILRSGFVRYTMYFFRISFLCCSRLVHKNHIFRYTITRIHLLPTNSSHQRPSSQTHLIHPLKHLDWKPRHFEDGKID